MINILYTYIAHQLQDDRYQYYLNQLPDKLQDGNRRFHRWEDRHANLFGKILLLKGLEAYGYAADCLHRLQYNQYGRPALSPEIDFNISHSGAYVVCAIAKGMRLGVDIEQITSVNVEQFKRVMTATQWEEIYQSPDPVKTFFMYWTIKESVIKADSRGMSISLDNILFDENRVTCEDSYWYIRTIEIDPGYELCLASDHADMEYTLQRYPVF